MLHALGDLQLQPSFGKDGLLLDYEFGQSAGDIARMPLACAYSIASSNNKFPNPLFNIFFPITMKGLQYDGLSYAGPS